ncbi:MAG: hypothetical protein ACJ8F7_13125 [Gemmataceae bacterium]
MPTRNFRAVCRLLPLALLALLTGCPANKTGPAKTSSRAEKEDPLAMVRETLRREHDIGACRSVVAQLNAHISSMERKPAPLTAAERDVLAKDLHLSDAELNEVANSEFTLLDANYLEERLLLHDAIRSLGLNWTDGADLERASVAFAWAMRQTWLADEALPSLPVGPVLRRGFGNDTERATVVLALFQAIGLDAGLVGVPAERGPPHFWAVGARIGGDVYLFDAKSGRPLAAADRKGVATLKQARANSDLIKPAADGAKPPLDLKQAAEKSRVFLSPPLSALSPRMRFLQEELKLTPRLFLGVVTTELTANFATAGEQATFWNPPQMPSGVPEVSTPTRALAHYLPPGDGGFDRTDLQAAFAAGLWPHDRLPPVASENTLPPGVDAGRKLRQYFAKRFVDFLLADNKPRDQELRGQFDEATRALVDMMTEITKRQDLIASTAPPELDANAAQWAREIRTASAELLRLEKSPSADPQTLEDAKSRVAGLEKASEPMVMVVERALAEPLTLMASYQLALCKHEQAERQARRQREPEATREAWQNAAGWWSSFLSKATAQAGATPAQIAHAKALHAVAEQGAK